jgi:hypothetical protein
VRMSIEHFLDSFYPGLNLSYCWCSLFFCISYIFPCMFRLCSKANFFDVIINRHQKVCFVRYFLIVSHGIPILVPRTHGNSVFVTLIWNVFFIPALCSSYLYILRVV